MWREGALKREETASAPQLPATLGRVGCERIDVGGGQCGRKQRAWRQGQRAGQRHGPLACLRWSRRFCTERNKITEASDASGLRQSSRVRLRRAGSGLETGQVGACHRDARGWSVVSWSLWFCVSFKSLPASGCGVRVARYT